MITKNLPDDLRGNWIWCEEFAGDIESYSFFRKKFALGELPGSAELYISCRSYFQLSVNGEFVCYNLDVCPVRGSYVWIYDITHLLETGSNTLSLFGHNVHVARVSCRCQPSGLWCQLNIDEKPYLWTDKSWEVFNGKNCYLGNRPRRSEALGFTEKVDYRYFPLGWRSHDFDSSAWQQPAYCQTLEDEDWSLLAFPETVVKSGKVPCSREVITGKFKKEHPSVSVNFQRLVADRGEGVYGAETYLYADQEKDVNCLLFADNPYRFFVNGEDVKNQGVQSLQPGRAFQCDKSLCFRQGEITEPETDIHLRKGWNRINLYEQSCNDSVGITLVFSSLDLAKAKFRRDPAEDSMPGWNIYGPMQTPLANLFGMVVLRELEDREFYISGEERILDESAELCSFSFQKDREKEQIQADNGDNFYDLTLEEGEYAVFSAPNCQYGYPELTLNGTSGDEVDVVAGTEIGGNYVMPYRETRRNVDSIILGSDACEWSACLPRGVKYVMLVVRKASGNVEIKDVGVRSRYYAFENQGHFHSSDEVLNNIWAGGLKTLQGTVQDIFIDSPCKEETQFIADAMIQSWTVCGVYGDFNLSGKALEEFASSQFETGEMPAAAPSGIYLNIPDYALLWPVWLQKYYLYSGRKTKLDSLIPNLKQIFAYFKTVSLPGSSLLGDLREACGGYCFLDHAEIECEGIVTGLNALYSRALLSGAWLFEQAGLEEEANECRQRSKDISTELRALTWNSDKGLFADTYVDGQQSDSYTTQTNVLALYGGSVEPDEYKSIFYNLFSDEEPYYRMMPEETNNPYFNFFILEVAFALDLREWALNFMRWYWGSMLEQGATTWREFFDPRLKPDEQQVGSDCYGYGVSASQFLLREVAGIRPAEPGFSSVYFNPLVSVVDSVRARVPTPYGHLTVDWKKDSNGDLEANISSNYPVSVIPELESGIAASATINVNEEVTVFAF